MKVIYKPRQMGKTLELIKLANNFNGHIIAINKAECERIMSMAEDHNCKINFPITATEFLSGNFYGKGVKKVYIDNADLLLQELAYGCCTLEAITLTQED